MFRCTPTRSLSTLAVMAGLLVAAAPAAAAPMLHGDFATFAANAQTTAGIDSGVVTDIKDPDKLSARDANHLSGALVAADFDYKEATG